MKELYHYHLTIEKCTSEELTNYAKLVGAKATTIDLYNNQHSQKDRMITKYFRKFDIAKKDAEDSKITIELTGAKVSRVKIEMIHAHLTCCGPGGQYYMEVHVKVKDDIALPKIPGFTLSRNPNEGTRFYNCRLKYENQIDWCKKVIEKIPNKVSVQYETVLYDSNPTVDSWWAKAY